MTTAEKKLAFIREQLENGRTVYVQTALRTWKLNRKHSAMVKVSGESLYMQNGNRWDCIDYCKLSAYP